MWTILETRDALKTIDKLPPKVAEKYDFWRAVVHELGPQGLRDFKGFHDEKLGGKLAHLRSSRLSLQWRVIYSAHGPTVTVDVKRITPHDYRE